MKKLRLLLSAVCLCILCLLLLTSCGGRLETPTGLYLDVETQTLNWDKNPDAIGYTVVIGDKEKTTKANYYSLESLEPGEYEIKIKAIGDGESTKDSSFAKFDYIRESETGLLYKLINNNTEYQLVGVGSATGDVVMEDEFRGKPVTSIAASAVSNNGVITSFTINNNVRVIPKKAFYNCNAMTSVTIPSTVTKIEENAFQSCKSLVSVVIPEGITEISDYTFSYCRALTSMTLSSATTRIGNYAFSDCTALTAIDIPDTVTEIGDYAFSNCKSAQSIKMSANVETIGESAFYFCELVDSISLGNKLTKIGNSAFSYCTKITEINIPATVKHIGTRAFNFCENLETVTTGEGIEYIGRYVLQGTKYYDNVTDDIVYLGNWIVACKNTDIQTDADLTPLIKEGTVGIAEYTFYGCNGFTGVTLPDVKYIGNYAFYKCKNLMEIKLGLAAESIGDCAFTDCEKLTNLFISNTSLIYIGDYAFNGCERLKTVDLPDTVESIGTQAFNNTGITPSVDGVLYVDNDRWAVGVSSTGVNNITIKDSTVGIADYTFFQCTFIGPVTFPDGLEIIGRGAFTLCLSISITEFPESLKKIDDYAFYACSWSVFGENYHLVLPEGLEYIGRSAFYNSNLVGLEIPGTCKYIGDYAFYGCGNLGSEVELIVEEETEESEAVTEKVQYYLILNEGIEYIGSRAFYGTGVTELVLPDSVTDLGIRAFYKCGNLKSVAIGNGIASVPEQAFYGCVSLESLTISDGVTEISKNAFNGCESLVYIDFGNTVETIGDYAFKGCASLDKLVLPVSVKNIGNYAFRGLKGATAIIFSNDVTDLGEHAVYGNISATIYCESESRPVYWHVLWNSSFRPVIWGCTLSEDKTYVVSFVKNSESIDNFDAINGISAPQRDGYDFVGWATSIDGAVEYSAQDIMNAPDGTTLYAVWQVAQISE